MVRLQTAPTEWDQVNLVLYKFKRKFGNTLAIIPKTYNLNIKTP